MQEAQLSYGPALAMLEITDIPIGLLTLDALAKESPVQIVGSGTLHGGNYLLLFCGEVEAVAFAHRKAISICQAHLRDEVLLPHAEERILPAIRERERVWPAPGDTLGAFQNCSIPTLIRAVDAALKGTAVELIELRLAQGMTGKATALLRGENYDMEAALELATGAACAVSGSTFTSTIIRNIDPEVESSVQHGTRFFRE